MDLFDKAALEYYAKAFQEDTRRRVNAMVRLTPSCRVFTFDPAHLEGDRTVESHFYCHVYSRRTVMLIRSAKKAKISASTERNILEVKGNVTLNDRSRIDSQETRDLLAELIDRGYSHKQLALWLGLKDPTLRVGPTITVRRAFEIEQLAKNIDAGLMRRS
jgi:hypothetical protein